MNANFDRLPTVLRCVTFLVNIGMSLSAATQMSVKDLSADELLDMMHREDAREEYGNRLKSLSEEERAGLRERLRKHVPDKRFPEDYSNIELLEQYDDPNDFKTNRKILEELKLRYDSASIALRAEFFELVRTRMSEVWYPDRADRSQEAHVARAYFDELAKLAGEVFPEQIAVQLLVEGYIERELPFGIPRFLAALENVNEKSEASARFLEQLHMNLTTYPITVRAEHDYALYERIFWLLGQCGEPGLEALERLDWRTSYSGIQSVALSGVPHAADMLIELYEATPVEQTDKRLHILYSLARHQTKTGDQSARNYLRSETSMYLSVPDGAFYISSLRKAVAIANESNDPYFLVDLQRLRSTSTQVLQEAEEGRVSAQELESTISNLFEQVDDTITRLNAP